MSYDPLMSRIIPETFYIISSIDNLTLIAEVPYIRSFLTLKALYNQRNYREIDLCFISGIACTAHVERDIIITTY